MERQIYVLDVNAVVLDRQNERKEHKNRLVCHKQCF